MSRRFSKIAFLCAAALMWFLSFSSAASTCNVAWSAWWEYTFADNSCAVPDAILTVKRVIATGDHFQWFMAERDKDTAYMPVPTDAQQAQYDAAFSGLVYTIRFNQNRNSASKLASSLQGLLGDMRAKYNDETLSFDDRAKFAYLYFLSFETVAALKNTPTTSIPDNSTWVGSTAGLTVVQSYTALNSREYTIWQSQLFYLFSRWDSDDVIIERRARSLNDLINYIEYQNRVIVRAPNGRYYAIRKHNSVFKINRDNGSVLDQDFASFDVARNMLDTCAVHGIVPVSQRVMCAFGSYGRK